MSRWAPRPEVDRFWSYASPEPMSGCWFWTGHVLGRGGYGKFNRIVRGKHVTVYAHRFAYELAIGPIPEGLQIDHLCRVRCCVNPKHLEAVTQQENIRRGEAGLKSGAKARARTHCIHGHEFSASNTYLHGNHRICRACRNQRKRAKRNAL